MYFSKSHIHKTKQSFIFLHTILVWGSFLGPLLFSANMWYHVFTSRLHCSRLVNVTRSRILLCGVPTRNSASIPSSTRNRNSARVGAHVTRNIWGSRPYHHNTEVKKYLHWSMIGKNPSKARAWLLAGKCDSFHAVCG